jgi:CheY-like chemotaxis protein
MINGLLLGKRVLVVEDEMLVLMGIMDMVANLGCTSIAVAGSVDKAMQLLSTDTFDLATLDVNLNGERSYPVAKALGGAGVPFAFSTAYGDNGFGDYFSHHPVLRKPYTLFQFEKVMSRLVVDTLNSTSVA